MYEYVVGCYRSATGEEEPDIRQRFRQYREAARFLRDELRWLSEDTSDSRIFDLAVAAENEPYPSERTVGRRSLYDCGEFTYYIELEDDEYGGLFA